MLISLFNKITNNSSLILSIFHARIAIELASIRRIKITSNINLVPLIG